MTKEVIHVGLYGGKGLFGGKETPLEASVVSCDMHESCSFFQNGQCLKIRGITSGCKFGSVENIKGYTSRAKKYREFRNKWESHEKYQALSRTPEKLGVIGEYVVFPYPFIRIVESESGGYKLEGPSFASISRSYIPLKDFTKELIYRICTYKPQAILGGEITSYQSEKVPLFLSHLEEVMPTLYEEVEEHYPEIIKKKDYVGRKAFLHSVKPSLVYYESKSYPEFNETWEWDGLYLTYKKGHHHKSSITNDYELIQFKIKPSEKSVITITDNSQVIKDTVFID